MFIIVLSNRGFPLVGTKFVRNALERFRGMRSGNYGYSRHVDGTQFEALQCLGGMTPDMTTWSESEKLMVHFVVLDHRS